MQRLIVGCMACGWTYIDPPGMGVHRAPITCPECDGRVRAIPDSAWMENRNLKALIAQHTPKPRRKADDGLPAKCIKRALELGARLWRNNVGTLRDARGGYVTYGLCVGSSDLIGYTPVVVTQEMVGRTVAVFTAIEAKSARGVATDRQLGFVHRVQQDGGIAQIVRSVRELEYTLKGKA